MVKRAVAFLILLFFFSGKILAADVSYQVQTYLEKAASLYESFQYQEAAAVLQESRLKNNRLIGIFLAKLLYLSGEGNKAYRLIQSAESKNWHEYLYLGLICEDLGYTNQAKDAYQASLKLRQSSIALFRLAKIYYNEKKHDKAASLLQELLRQDSSQRLAHYYLGLSYLGLKKPEDAYRHLARSALFYPHSSTIESRLQEARKQLGEEFFVRQRKIREERRRDVVLPSYQKQTGLPMVRIGIAVGIDQFSFQSPAQFKIKSSDLTYQAQAGLFYTFQAKNNELFLLDRESRKEYARFSAPVEIVPDATKVGKHPFYKLDIVYGREDFWHRVVDKAYRGRFEVLLKERKINLINVVSIEEYLYGVLSAEIPSGSSREALKAQAVLARSLALRRVGRHSRQGFDFCADIHCQVYHGLSAETEATKEAIDATRGEVIVYQGEIPEIFYHSNCGGILSSDVFGQLDYLAAGSDSKTESLPDSAYGRYLWFLEGFESFCALESANFRWQRIYDCQDFELIFGTNLQSLESINTFFKSEPLRYNKAEISWSQKAIPLESGLAIRNYFDRLRSSSFLAELKKRGIKHPNMLIFWGAGFGHGSGLCQAGAIGMAEAGYDYKEIIKHYYPKAYLEKQY